MHPRELIEVAGLVALNGPLLVAASPPSSSPSPYLEQYWTTSKGRFESWNRVLRSCAAQGAQSSRQDFDCWIEARGVLDEIFASEGLGDGLGLDVGGRAVPLRGETFQGQGGKAQRGESSLSGNVHNI